MGTLTEWNDGIRLTAAIHDDLVTPQPVPR
jgi:hypothetical protein